jgi:hypothetical protein
MTLGPNLIPEDSRSNIIPKDPKLNHTTRRIRKDSQSRFGKESKSKSDSNGAPRLSWTRNPNIGLPPPLSL